MKEIKLTVSGLDVDFEDAQSIAESIASRKNPETDLMAWYDKTHDRHSPSIVECNKEGTPGWEEYGRHHGGKLEIKINNGDYVFIYT